MLFNRIWNVEARQVTNACFSLQIITLLDKLASYTCKKNILTYRIGLKNLMWLATLANKNQAT